MDNIIVVKAVILLSMCVHFALTHYHPLRQDLRMTGGLCQVPGEGSCTGIDTRGKNSSKLYQKLGRTVPEAALRGWVPFLRPSRFLPHLATQDCYHGGRFNGYQWMDPHEPLSVFLLYDVQCTIAGIQFWMSYSDALKGGPSYQYSRQPMMQNATIAGMDYYYITVYFIEPSLICTVGRPAYILERDGTVSGLYVQVGPTPFHSQAMPMTRLDALMRGAADNNCFRGMGWHTFYDHSKWDSDGCTSYQPFVTIFDHQGQLNAFAFFTTGQSSASNLEKPPSVMTALIAGKENGTALTPKCLLQVHEGFGLTTLHIYFTERPYDFKCP